MATASVSELKTSLSDYLDQVKAGGEIIVTERGHAIARVVPFNQDVSAQARSDIDNMIRAGIIWPAKRKATPNSLPAPRVHDPDGLALRMLLQDREESR